MVRLSASPPRSVWGSRRHATGRPELSYEGVFKDGISPTLEQEWFAALGQWDMIPKEMWEKQVVKNGAYYRHQINTGLYYGMHFARVAWWYAQHSDIMDKLDPVFASGVNMFMGAFTQLMGITATAVYGGTAAATGNVLGALASVVTLPIQFATLGEFLKESQKEQQLIRYNLRRERILDARLIKHG